MEEENLSTYNSRFGAKIEEPPSPKRRGFFVGERRSSVVVTLAAEIAVIVAVIPTRGAVVVVVPFERRPLGRSNSELTIFFKRKVGSL